MPCALRRASSGLTTHRWISWTQAPQPQRGTFALFGLYHRAVRAAVSRLVCASVNEVIVHGIPGRHGARRRYRQRRHRGGAGWLCRRLGLDLRCRYAQPEAQRLLEVTEACLWRALDQARAGNRLATLASDPEHAERDGLGVPRVYSHGVGRKLARRAVDDSELWPPRHRAAAAAGHDAGDRTDDHPWRSPDRRTGRRLDNCLAGWYTILRILSIP